MTAIVQLYQRAVTAVSAIMPSRSQADDYSRELTEEQTKLMRKIAEDERASWVSHKRES
ncbi:hypothetical protein V1292_005138 [Bradyrhizobium sp. AZCC 1719]|uniref:hypothetical protein n=1 Tax=Bradyrhizobium sp. AZCC 1719 TaxID=3117028 RepID=UPI002FF358D0